MLKPRITLKLPGGNLAVRLTPEAAVRGALFFHLMCVPLAFSRATVEGFEFVKFLGLLLTALLIVLLASFAAPRFTRQQLKSDVKQPLVLAAIAFLLSAAISTVFSVSPHTSFYGHHDDFEGMLTLLGYGIVFAAARWTIRTDDEVQLLMAAIALASSAATAYGFLQVFNQDPLEWADYSIIGGSRRPFATFGHPNFLGAYLVLALPCVAWLSIRAGGVVRIALFVLAAAMLVLTLLTLSRAAWLGLAFATLTAFAGWRLARVAGSNRILAGSAVFALVVVIVAMAATPRISERAERFFDSAGRLEIWQAAWKIFLDRPLIGCGPDLFAQMFGRYGSIAYRNDAWGQTPGRAHNELLHIMATQGSLGLVAVLAALAALAYTLCRAWRCQPKQRPLLVALASALGGFAVTELFGFTVIACGSLASVLCAIASRLGERQEPSSARAAKRPVSPSRKWGACAAVAICLWLSFELVIDPWRASVCSRNAQMIGADSPQQALLLDEQAVRICPHEPVFWNRLAMHAEELGRSLEATPEQLSSLERALSAYREATARDCNNGYYRAGQGRALGELCRLGHAQQGQVYAAFDEALRVDPGNAYTYVDASRAALLLENSERMGQYAEAGLRRFPEFGLLREQRALRWLLLNRPTEAAAAFQDAINSDWRGHYIEYYRCAAIFDEFKRRMSLANPNAKNLRSGER